MTGASVYRPINTLAKTGCEYDIADISLDNDAETPDNILKLIKDNTHMIVLTHVSNVCGKILPVHNIIKKIKEKNPNIIVIIDAAQSAGVLDIDVERDKIDILCVPAHKGMFGICGLGVMVFNDRLDITKASTFLEGGTGIHSLDESMPEDLPERFEAGTPNVPAIATLSAGVEYINSETLEKIYAYEKNLYNKAIDILKNLKDVSLYSDFTDKGYIGPILFNVKHYKCEEVARRLAKSEICTRDGFHCAPLAHKKLGTINSGGVRISLNYHNKSSELDKFYKVIKDL
jgi:selenocysteine lyase/cysteine desulfurase